MDMPDGQPQTVDLTDFLERLTEALAETETLARTTERLACEAIAKGGWAEEKRLELQSLDRLVQRLSDLVEVTRAANELHDEASPLPAVKLHGSIKLREVQLVMQGQSSTHDADGAENIEFF